MLWITLVLFIVGETAAQVWSSDKCPTPQPMPKFDVSQMMGVWYEYKYYMASTALALKCGKDTWSYGKNGGVHWQLDAIEISTGKAVSVEANLKRKVNAVYDAKFPKIRNWDKTYNILAADYQTWALLQSCLQYKKDSKQYGWILTRSRTPSPTVIKQAYEAAKGKGLDGNLFQQLDQTRC